MRIKSLSANISLVSSCDSVSYDHQQPLECETIQFESHTVPGTSRTGDGVSISMVDMIDSIKQCQLQNVVSME